MAALKWIVVVLCALAAAAALAMGVIDGAQPRERKTFSTPPLSLRTFAGGAPAVAAPVEAAPVAEVPKADEPELDAIEPVAAPKTPVVDEKKEEKKPAAAPAPVVAKPAAAGGGDGIVNLRASDTADVFLDGKKVGGSPVLGLKVKAGAHKARFDCYDSAGNTIPGALRAVTVVANEEADVEFSCPAE